MKENFSEVAEVRVGDFVAKSSVEVSMDEENGFVRGDEIVIENLKGEVLYENLRAFMPIKEDVVLLRYADGFWTLVDGKKKKSLHRINLRIGPKAILFDERGKAHFSQENPHYSKIVM
jgi:hypothetical protein